MKDNYKIKSVGYDDKKGRYRYNMEIIPNTICPYCGEDHSVPTHNFEWEMENITPDDEIEDIIVSGTRRQCMECGKHFVPVKNPDFKRFTNETIEYLLKEYVETFDSEGIGSRIGIKSNMLRNYVRRYIEQREKADDYILPAVLGVEEINVSGEDSYILSDVNDLSLLDVLPKEKMPDLKNVEMLVTTDEGLFGNLEKEYPKKNKVLVNEGKYDKALTALAEDAREINKKIDILPVLKNGNDKELRKLLEKPPALFNIVLIYNLEEDEFPKAESLPLNMKNTRRLVSELEYEPKTKIPEIFEVYRDKINPVKQSLENPVSSRLTPSVLRGNLLYLNNNRKSITDENGNILVSFKKPL